MKREEKNTLARQRILEAALEEFSAKGYEGASLSAVCAERGISKGIVYHHFRDKDELYLLCASACFDALTAYMREAAAGLSGTVEEQLRQYFDARLRFFAENALYLGIFVDTLRLPPAVAEKAAACRRNFDRLGMGVLTELLERQELRDGLSAADIVDDIRSYMDFVHLRFRTALDQKRDPETVLREHEEICRRQLDLLLYGAMKGENRV